GNAAEDEDAHVGHAPIRERPQHRVRAHALLDEERVVPPADRVRAGQHVAGVRLELAPMEDGAARLDEALVPPSDDHDDSRAPRAAGRLHDEVVPHREARPERAHAPLRVADVVERGRGHAVGGERRLRRELVVDEAMAVARVPAEEVAVVPAVQPEHLGPQAAETRDHGGASGTARRKRTYSRTRRPRHFPRSTPKATVASRISGYASTSDWSPPRSTTR